MKINKLTNLDKILKSKGFEFDGLGLTTTENIVNTFTHPDLPNGTFIKVNGLVGSLATFAAAAQSITMGTNRELRSLVSIYNDINSLTNSQKLNIWNDLTSGSPIKISTNKGNNAGNIFLIWRITENTSLPIATVTDMKLTAITYYTQDNPNYLVNPSFDNTINIPGDTSVAGEENPIGLDFPSVNELLFK